MGVIHVNQVKRMVFELGDIEQDESFIMRKATDEDGNPCFQSLDDEKLIERIYEAYLEQSEER